MGDFSFSQSLNHSNSHSGSHPGIESKACLPRLFPSLEHHGKERELAGNREFDVVTFDCYGTLIDWQTGIRTAFKQSLRDLGLTQSQESKMFDLYQEEERRVEAQEPYKSYREVLSDASSAAARRLGKNIPETLSGLLAQQLPTWDPFPDTNPALERLARKFKLGILSNIDDDLLAGTLKHFTVPFDIVVTAERVRSYKPGFKHFQEARRIIGDDRTWLHVAASLYHDVEPASRLSINTAWVNRKNSNEGRKYLRSIVREVKDLTQLTDWLSP
jgi:2-haloalkanoic acid dehalogenase type II